MSDLLECGHVAVLNKYGRVRPCRTCYYRRYYAKNYARPVPEQESIGYSAAHKRVIAARGHAKDQTCQECGEPAREWAYCHCSPVEQTGYRTMNVRGHDIQVFSRWSPRPADYIAMCRDCHVRFDSEHAE